MSKKQKAISVKLSRSQEKTISEKIVMMQKKLALDCISADEIRRLGSMPPNYCLLQLSYSQFIVVWIAGSVMFFILAFLFYKSIVLSLLFSSLGLIVPRLYRKKIIESRRNRLRLQFKESLSALSSAIAAGKSLEKACESSLEDLLLIYPEPNSLIVTEFQWIVHRLHHQEPLEHVLLDFAKRSEIDEIIQFAEVLAACKRSGGNLMEVMRRTAAVINEKLAAEQEIMVLVAQKRLESKIMMAVPFVFLAFLQFAAPDYLAPLYSGFGYLLLTAALCMLGGCFWLIGKIMNIQV